MRISVVVSILVIGSLTSASANDEDFAFESSYEMGSQRDFLTDWSAPRQHFVASVGKVFHLVVPQNFFGENISKFEAKLETWKPLPRWLLFDKVNAVFWGVPLEDDSGSISVVVKNLGDQKHVTKNIVIDVVPYKSGRGRCASSEDVTMLTLVIDKGIEAIKPKQRVMAVNDISKFFGLPYSAFVLKPLNGRDDIADSSVILAGPGNLMSRTSTSTSSLEVPVGCDGRLFPKTVTVVHQLKQQAKDGTITEVMRLPLVGWRVKITSDAVKRERRQALDPGSGDYDGDYYDDYEEEPDDYEEEKPITTHIPPPKTSTTTTTTTSTASYENTSTHHHRHHHGEPKKDEIIPVWPIVVDDSVSTDNLLVPLTSPKVPQTTSTTVGVITVTTKPTIASTITPSTTTRKSTTSMKVTTKSANNDGASQKELPPILDNIDDYDYGDYKTEDYEAEDDEAESETIVPIIQTQDKVETETKSTSAITTVATTTTTTTTTTEAVIVEETTVPIEVTTNTKEVPIVVDLEVTKTENTIDQASTTDISNFHTEPETTITTTLVSSKTTTASTTPMTTTTFPTTTTTTTQATTTYPPTVPSTTTSPPTTVVQTTPEVFEELTTPTKLTTLRHVSSSSPSITTSVEEDLEVKNYPPYIENRLKRKNVIAGKIFRFVIPPDTFKDSEDGYDLKLEFLDLEENPVTANSWCQFNPARSEVYGLPLDDHVSKWEYWIRAIDKDGASVQDKLTILVQQHKLQRVFNHEFSLEIRIEKKEEFKHYIDWSLKTLRALGRIYNTNMSEITVRKVSHVGQPAVFAWSNDSLPTSYCPKPEIEKSFKILTANDRGDPSRELNIAVSPELRVKKVSFLGIGVCEELNTPIAPPVNYPPILRNPVNHINATLGELLVFRVPKDTFYDPEDLDTLSLNLTLLTGERQEIPKHNWLQFDSKNREFFGIPRKISRNEYQLVCIDSGGLPVIDSLEVVVYPSPKVSYNVEFSMTIETLFDTFINSAVLQKKFVEKLMGIFGDKNASHIHFLPFKQKQHSTIATWYNKSLSIEKCDHEQIARLEAMMKNDERGISNRVHSMMEPDFQVSTIKVLPMSNCKVHKPKYHTPKLPEDKIIIDESAQTTSSSDEYLLTFIIPVVVISIMTFFALLAACILYRRRRTGKMNVVEEGRQSYGNKGIPVIFQEELDEKPEVGTKAPVILKDEKPPLAPPEYSKSGSLKFNDDSEPYHPPPPFTRTQDNGKQSRPKPAPTYRKPPPQQWM